MRSPIAGSSTYSISDAAPASSFGATTWSTRQLEAEVPDFRAMLLDFAGRIEQIVFDQRPADVQPPRLEERVGHRATDQQRVDSRDQVLNHFQLVGHLGAAEDRDEWTVRMLEHSPQVFDFRRHQQAGP